MLKLEIFIPIILLFFSYLTLKTDIHKTGRLIVCLIITALSLGFSFHLYPDIQNWLLADGVTLSKGAPSFNYYWNFDKPFIGFFVLGLRLKLIENREDLRKILCKTLVFSLILVALFITAALFLNLVKFDLKLPSLAIPWLIGNLFFVVIPEECFFRGFLQKEIKDAIQSQLAPLIAIFLVSLVFAAAHLFFIQNLSYIALAFVASFAYGAIYEWDKVD